MISQPLLSSLRKDFNRALINRVVDHHRLDPYWRSPNERLEEFASAIETR